MALNLSHATCGVGVILFNGERILLFCEDVEFLIESEGSSVAAFKGHKKGLVYLTTHRVIFLNRTNADPLQSFSTPFLCLREVELEQPVFGANYIKGKVLAEPNGGWVGKAKFKLWFNSGGAIEFGQAMLRAGQLASRNAAHAATQQPPAYGPPGNYYPAPPPCYSPPTDPIYGWVPYAAFPTAPPATGVYMMDAPPPYPGVMAMVPPYTQMPPAGGPTATGGYSAPAAYVSAFDPHTAYVPPPAFGAASAPPYEGDVCKRKVD